MRTFTVYGRKVKAHDASCADGFRTDRRYGMIYVSPLVLEDDGSMKAVSWEEASCIWDYCVYCGPSSERRAA